MRTIHSVTAHPVVAPLAQSQKMAFETREAITAVIVEIRTSDGIRGLGKVSTAALGEVSGWVERLAELVGGHDCAPVAVAHTLFGHLTPALGRGALPRGARGSILAAMAGIDFALWDILGKAAGLPVFRLLGGENRPVPAYSTGGYYDEDATPRSAADELSAFVAEGFRAVKLKGGGSPLGNEAARVAAVREAIGPAIQLMVDASGAYDIGEAIDYANAIAPYDITFLEEPLHWYLQPADHLRLAQGCRIPIAHGEREMTRFTTRDFVASGAIRYVQFDATRHSGFTEALRVAHFAEAHGVMIAPHHAPELHAHLVAAFPRCGFGVEAHGLPALDPIWHNIFAERAELREGAFHLSEKPGFGVELDWDFIRRHRP